MINSLSIVGTNVLIIFILIIVGFVCGKIKLISNDGIKTLNNIMLYIVTPCVIINALSRDFDTTLLKNFLMAALGAVISHFVSFVFAMLMIRDKDESRRVVMRFAAIFSNCGFMSLPLIEAICGSDGLFLGAAYMIVFNLFGWSFGQRSLAKGRPGYDAKMIVLNPGIISSVIGLLLFFFPIKIPYIILSPIQFMAGLNTPVPMLIIGFSLSLLDPKDYLNIKNEWKPLLIRLVLAPSITLLILYFLGIRDILLVTTMISSSAPIAASTTMFSIRFDRDSSLASKLVAVSSLFSVVTMTIIVSIAKFIA